MLNLVVHKVALCFKGLQIRLYACSNCY